jgi:hypothetical protein
MVNLKAFCFFPWYCLLAYAGKVICIMTTNDTGNGNSVDYGRTNEMDNTDEEYPECDLMLKSLLLNDNKQDRTPTLSTVFHGI